MRKQSGQRQPTATSLATPQQSGILQRACACGQHTVAGGECAGCKKKREMGMLQRVESNTAQVDATPAVVHDVLRTPGQPLDAATRAYMEPRFGHDFSRVRLHTNAQAGESARAVDALAYTVGNHLVLDSHHLPSYSYARDKVLAHELAHVVQQSHMVPPSDVQVRDDTRLEAQADEAARRIMRGQAVRIGAAPTSGIMRTPRSLDQPLDPQMMTQDEIRRELDEIDRYLEISVLSEQTIERLNKIRQQLVARQQGPSSSPSQQQSSLATPPPTASGPPFFGLQPGANAFQGIEMYYTVSALPQASRVQYTFNRGPYLIALNEARTPDGSRRIAYYIAYRRADTLVVGNEGWNEYVVGPDSIESFLNNLSLHVGVAAPVYMFGPPAPYQAASGRVVQRLMEGNFGAAASAFGEAWSEAVRDPGWWAQVASAGAGALAEAPVATAPGKLPGPRGPSIAGGRPGPVSMRPGPAGSPVVASGSRVVAAEGTAARASTAIEGNTARSLAQAPAVEPVATPRPALKVVPDQAPGVGVPRQSTSIAPAVGAVGVVGGSAARPRAADQSAPATSGQSAGAPVTAIELGDEPHQRRKESQTCTNDVLDALQAEKDRICNSIPSQPDWSPSRSDKMLNRIKCSEIRPRLKAFEECLRIRQEIQDTCFRDAPVDVHLDTVMPELERGLENGRRRLAINCAPGHPMANQ